MTSATTEFPVFVRATLRHARFSASKAREVLKVIRGQPFEQAQLLLKRTPRGPAEVILKLLKSVGANAETNERLIADELYVFECYADEGSTIKRWRPRARGRATRIRKRTCNITIVLARMPDEILETLRAKKASQAQQRRERVAKSKQAQQKLKADKQVETVEDEDVKSEQVTQDQYKEEEQEKDHDESTDEVDDVKDSEDSEQRKDLEGDN